MIHATQHQTSQSVNRMTEAEVCLDLRLWIETCWSVNTQAGFNPQVGRPIRSIAGYEVRLRAGSGRPVRVRFWRRSEMVGECRNCQELLAIFCGARAVDPAKHPSKVLLRFESTRHGDVKNPRLGVA